MIRFSCPACGQPFEFRDADGGKQIPCAVCGATLHVPPVPRSINPGVRHLSPHDPHQRVRTLVRSLRLIRVRQAVRRLLDRMHLGSGVVERLCAALILTATTFFLLFVLIAGKFTTVVGLLWAGVSAIMLFIPTAAMIVWRSDDDLSRSRRVLELELLEARKEAARYEAAMDTLTSREDAEEERRNRDSREKRARRDLGERASGGTQSSASESGDNKPKFKPSEQLLGCAVMLVLGTCLVLGLKTCGSNGSGLGDNSSLRGDAWYTAKQFVKELLKAPSTASFGDQTYHDRVTVIGSEYIVRGWVDSQNGFGANLRSDFEVRMRHDEINGKWVLSTPPTIDMR